MNPRFVNARQEREFRLYHHLANRVDNRYGMVLTYVGWAAFALYPFLFYRSSSLVVGLPILLVVRPLITLGLAFAKDAERYKPYWVLLMPGNIPI